MKWFKHISTSIDDPFIQDLLDEFGHVGYASYFILIELLAQNFDVKSPGLSDFSLAFVRRKLRISQTKLEQLLNFCSEEKKIFFKIYTRGKKRIMINCPKLKEMCDEWTKKTINKLRSNSVESQAIEEEEDKEEDKDKYSDESDEVKLSNLLLSYMIENNPKCKQPKDIQSWAKHIDYMIRLDNRTVPEIEEIIIWCQRNPFWMGNILSTSKLRYQFDQLTMQKNRNNPKDNLPILPDQRAYKTDKQKRLEQQEELERMIMEAENGQS